MAGVFPWYNPFNTASWLEQAAKKAGSQGQPPLQANIGQAPAPPAEANPSPLESAAPVSQPRPTDRPYGVGPGGGPFDTMLASKMQEWGQQLRTQPPPSYGAAPSAPQPSRQPVQPSVPQGGGTAGANPVQPPVQPSSPGPGGGVQGFGPNQPFYRYSPPTSGSLRPQTQDPNYAIAVQRYEMLGPQGIDTYGKWLLGLPGGIPPTTSQAASAPMPASSQSALSVVSSGQRVATGFQADRGPSAIIDLGNGWYQSNHDTFRAYIPSYAPKAALDFVWKGRTPTDSGLGTQDVTIRLGPNDMNNIDIGLWFNEGKLVVQQKYNPQYLGNSWWQAPADGIWSQGYQYMGGTPVNIVQGQQYRLGYNIQGNTLQVMLNDRPIWSGQLSQEAMTRLLGSSTNIRTDNAVVQYRLAQG